METFQDTEGLVKKRVEIHVEIQDMVIILNTEAKHYTLLHRTTIVRRNQIYI